MPASITVGDAKIVSVLDMVPPSRAATDFFPDVPGESWQPYEDALTDGMLQLYYGCFFVATKGTVVLVDTGMGPGPHPSRGNRTGDLLHQLRAKGVMPGDVDAVVHTHLHADHVGWNVDLSGDAPVPNFPNARYFAPALDWRHFTQPDVLDTAPQVKENVVPLHDMGLLELIEGEHAVTEEITALPAPRPHAGPPGDRRDLAGGDGSHCWRLAPRQGADRKPGLVRRRGHGQGRQRR